MLPTIFLCIPFKDVFAHIYVNKKSETEEGKIKLILIDKRENFAVLFLWSIFVLEIKNGNIEVI